MANRRKGAADETVGEQPFRRSERLDGILRRQEEVISLAQLREIGFSRQQVRTKRSHGELLLVHSEVFKARRHISARGHLHAAVLSAGPDSFLSDRTAAGVYGLRAINPYQIHVTVPGHPKARPGSRLILHGTAKPVHSADTRVYDGLRVATVPRMFVELSAHESLDELKRLITASVQRGLFDSEAMRAALTRHAGRRGVPLLREALHRYTYVPRDKSTFERDFAAYLALYPDIPTPVRNCYMGPWEIDCAWPAQRFCVELDGRRYHEALAQRDRDNAKDSWLQRHGFRCLRITDFRFEHDRNSIRPELLDFLRG